MTAALGALACLVPATAEADTVWLCHPAKGSDPCRASLETTVQRADGSSRVVHPRIAARPGYDCFYVYPTISDQPTRNATKAVDPQLEAVARFQANRFARRCAVYAPVYRQVTVPALLTESTEELAEGLRFAYPDVRRAWLEYWRARRREDRPFVLIGHSQGAGMLVELMRDLIDRRPAMRRAMLSAMVPGIVPSVPRGERVGGDLKHIPACAKRRQHGCVMGWATYDEAPPDDTRYGVPNERFIAAFGWRSGARFEAVCTNPGLPPDGSAVLRPLVRTDPLPGSVGVAVLALYEFQPPLAPTPWVQPADRYGARCARANGAHVLRVEPVGSSRDLRPSPDDTWGLHVADLNIGLVNLQRVLRAQLRDYRGGR